MLKTIKKVFKNEFFQGGIFLMSSSMLVNLLNYFFNFLVGRSIGPKGYGEIATLFSYAAIALIPTAVLNTLIIQKIGSVTTNPYNFTYSLELFFWQKLKNWWFVFIFSLVFIPFVPKITNLSPLTGYLLIPIILLGLLSSFYLSAVQGLKLFLPYSFLNVGSTILKLLGAVLVFYSLGGFPLIIFFIVFSTITLLAGGILILRRSFKKHLGKKIPYLERRLIKIMTSKSFLIISSSIFAFTILSNFDIVFVKKFFSAVDAGLYSSWALFAKIIFYVTGPILTISFIFFTSKKHLNKHRVMFLLTLLIFFAIGFCSFVAYHFFGSLIIQVFFGDKFAKVIPYLTYASIFGSLYSIMSYIVGYFIAKKSLYTLILPALIPFYMVSLFLVPKELLNIMKLNISFSLLATILYLIAYFKSASNSNTESLKSFFT